MKLWDPIARRDREHRLPRTAEIEETAQRLLLEAGIERAFPTPIAPIARLLDLKEEVCPPIEFIDSYTAGLPISHAAALSSALKKTVGWKCGRHFCIHPWSAGPRGARKAALHEIGHEALPWHQIPGTFELTPEGHDAFDVEANALASELIFQGSQFDALASAMPIRAESVKRLADHYEAPWHDALVRFVDRHRDSLALLVADGKTQRIVAAATSAIAMGLDQGVNAVATTSIESFDVGLRTVGVRRYDLVAVTRGRRHLRLAA